MPYTFGAGAGDDITWAVTNGYANQSALLVTGWFLPTTLTATRKLWSFSNVTSAGIDTVDTSELRLISDHATTDGIYTTTGAGLTVDQWSFVAVFWHGQSTGSSSRWEVWTGTLDTAPERRTITTVTGASGAVTAASSSFTVGNQGTNSLAWEGDIANVTVMASSAGASATGQPFMVGSYANAATAQQLEHLYWKLVLPAWRGDIAAMNLLWSSGSLMWHHATLEQGFAVVGNSRNSAGSLLPIAPTVNGATPSQNGSPRPSPSMLTLPVRRRW